MLFRSRNRLPSLYSDLTVQKTTNPEGYAANVAAWQAALTRAALAGQLPTEQRLILQTSDELLNALASPQYGRPSGLGNVIDDCVRSGKMMDLKEFQAAEKSIYARNWIPSPWTVLRWGLRQAGVVGSGSYDVSGRLRASRLVLVQALEEVSKEVLAAQEKKGQSMTDRLMTREAFSKELAALSGSPLSDQDSGVLLRYLSRDKHALSYDDKTVKFKAPASAEPEALASEDGTVANLKSLIASLETQIAGLEARIVALQVKAQASVKSGNKAAALSALRSKKLADKSLQQRTDTLQQLEQVYTSIEQAADQVQIVQAMEASAGVLKGLNKRVGGVESVEDVVENLREEMGKVEEVGQVLQEPLDGKVVLDEADVDDELEAMEKEEGEAKEAREAEATRKRLAEIDQVKKTKEREERGQEEPGTSADMLERMNIDEPTKDANAVVPRSEKVVEQA